MSVERIEDHRIYFSLACPAHCKGTASCQFNLFPAIEIDLVIQPCQLSKKPLGICEGAQESVVL